MKFRKLMLVLTLVVSIIFVSVIGATYAYYVTASGNVSLTTSDNVVGVVFTSDSYIDLNTGVPILPENIETDASKSKFTLTPNLSVYDKQDIEVAIGLSNIDIDSELKTKDFKYKLVCSNKVMYTDGTINYSQKQVFTGTFKDVKDKYYTITELSTDGTNNNKFIIDTSSLVTSQMYECTFYVWLEENGSNQNELMNKHFSSNIEINSMMKTR